MTRLITIHDPTSTTLAECVENLDAWGFDPNEGESVSHAAHWLRRLANNRAFLGELLVARLKNQNPASAASIRARQLLLGEGSRGGFELRATIWPSACEEGMYAPAPASIAYDLAHDHPFDFLTTGYFGPGYACENFEYDADAVIGLAGEQVEIRRLGCLRLMPSRVLHYRAGRDIHRLQPPASLSVTLNLTSTVTAGRRQLAFNPEESLITGLVENDAVVVMLRLAVALGDAEAIDLAGFIGTDHADERMRLHAWEALAARAEDPRACDDVWRRAEKSGSRIVADAARKRRADVAG